MKKQLQIALIGASVLMSSCAIIRPGQVGVKSKLGKLDEKITASGSVMYNPFTSTIIRVPTRTINRELSMSLPSKEGLTIKSDVSILYKIEPSKVTHVIREIGLNYDQIITSVFRSAAADVCSQFFAKDMHSGERRLIENKITALMNEHLANRGFLIEAVLLKSITLPEGLAKAIELKLESEQDALRMEFILDQQRKEAERQIINAEAKKSISVINAQANAEVIRIEADAMKLANDMLNTSLTKSVLQMKQIEAMVQLATSPNAKTIFMDNKNPFMNMVDMK
jgi:prohibitin 1